MLDRVKFDTVSRLAKIEVRTQEEIEREEAERRERLMRALQAQHAELQPLLGGGELDAPEAGAGAARSRAGAESAPAVPAGAAARVRRRGRAEAGRGAEPAAAPFVRQERKVGRNEPCPCGSGKKYKHCHGALASTRE